MSENLVLMGTAVVVSPRTVLHKEAFRVEGGPGATV